MVDLFGTKYGMQDRRPTGLGRHRARPSRQAPLSLAFSVEGEAELAYCETPLTLMGFLSLNAEGRLSMASEP
jgi:hypothetical protein